MSSEKSGGIVSISPTVFSRLLRGNIVKAQELDIPTDSKIVQISCSDVQIGNCEIDDDGRLLLISIFCPSPMHHNTDTKYKTDTPCGMCGGKRGEPTLMSTKETNGQMICALTLQLAIYKGVTLPPMDEAEQRAASIAVTMGLVSLISGEKK